MQTGTEGYVT